MYNRVQISADTGTGANNVVNTQDNKHTRENMPSRQPSGSVVHVHIVPKLSTGLPAMHSGYSSDKSFG